MLSRSCSTPSTTLRLSDGRLVTLRAIRPSDSVGLRNLHRGLSRNTVYQRFFFLLDELPAAQAEQFADVDGEQRAAFVALDETGIVAVARYGRAAPAGLTAEVAIVVADLYQRHGLGTALMKLLAEEARKKGIQTFEADVLSSNVGIKHTFRDAGLEVGGSFDHGVAHLVMALT